MASICYNVYMEILKPLIIFCAVLFGGYYLFNYIKDEKGIGFKTVNIVYDVRTKEYGSDVARLTMKKDSTYKLEACNVATGTYEFIDTIYNFKVTGRESGNSCEKEMLEIEMDFHGKFRSQSISVDGAGNEKIKLDNDNSREFYLEKNVEIKQ